VKINSKIGEILGKPDAETSERGGKAIHCAGELSGERGGEKTDRGNKVRREGEKTKESGRPRNGIM